MAQVVTFSGLDASGDGTSTSLYFADLTAANFDAQETAMLAVQAAIQGVSLIAYLGTVYPAMFNPVEGVKPGDPFAQREQKFRLTILDTVNNRKSNPTISGSDNTLLIPGTEDLDLTAGAGLTLKTAIEANTISRDDNPVILTGGKYVGRNV